MMNYELASINNGTKIYLDYAATTPVDPRVAAAMQPYFDQYFRQSLIGAYLRTAG